MAIALDLVHRRAIHDVFEKPDGQTGDADKADLSRGLKLAQGGDGLVHDLVEIAELHVVNLDKIDVINPDTVEAFVHAASHAGGGEIEVGDVGAIAGDLGGEDVAVADNALQCLAENSLGLGRAVVGRGID